MCACVRACVRVRACVHACVRACVLVFQSALARLEALQKRQMMDMFGFDYDQEVGLRASLPVMLSDCHAPASMRGRCKIRRALSIAASTQMHPALDACKCRVLRPSALVGNGRRRTRLPSAKSLPRSLLPDALAAESSHVRAESSGCVRPSMRANRHTHHRRRSKSARTRRLAYWQRRKQQAGRRRRRRSMVCSSRILLLAGGATGGSRGG